MTNEKMYSADEVCKELNITMYTLSNWYRWQKKNLERGVATVELPEPIKLQNEKGRPRRWTASMVKQLKKYKESIVMGRNGIYGMYSNPLYKETKKYKKSIETVDKE